MAALVSKLMKDLQTRELTTDQRLAFDHLAAAHQAFEDRKISEQRRLVVSMKKERVDSLRQDIEHQTWFIKQLNITDEDRDYFFKERNVMFNELETAVSDLDETQHDKVVSLRRKIEHQTFLIKQLNITDEEHNHFKKLKILLSELETAVSDLDDAHNDKVASLKRKVEHQKFLIKQLNITDKEHNHVKKLKIILSEVRAAYTDLDDTKNKMILNDTNKPVSNPTSNFIDLMTTEMLAPPPQKKARTSDIPACKSILPLIIQLINLQELVV
jgi:hypothetical protein